ncbi:MAG TPA: zf-HC2 domain-containing protein [Ktedonobacteraceae bacterium]|nr:zf-HC2 domain-containing protein [Ktedonobacteraceae bacterium]
MMTCEELVSYLSDYLDQNLDEELAAAAQQHLATCQNCRVVVQTTRRVIQLGQAQYQIGLPPDRRDRLFTRLRQAFLAREGS